MILALMLQAAAPAPATGSAPCANPGDLPPRVAAKRCDGLALAGRGQWRDAAAAFEAAARAATGAAAVPLWAQAGNAWLAGGEPGKAGTAFDAGLVRAEGMSAFDHGELLLDRARAAVAAGDEDGARRVMDQALAAVPDDPLAWLLSATLARRMGDPKRAGADISEALKRSPDDAAVQLEAGNIAAKGGNADLAKERWETAARLQPDGPSGRAATAALAQFR